jgi:hypothetical protein
MTGITPAQFRALLAPEDVAHIAGGGIPVEARAYGREHGRGRT